MASWKKVIVSGSAAELSSLSLDTALTVPNGGTGLSTVASNGILYGNGTSALQVASAAANSVLITNGSNVPSLSATLPTAVQDNITRVGTIGDGVWQGTVIANAYVAENLTIDGGQIDDTVIGGTTAAAGTFTSITMASSGDITGVGSDIVMTGANSALTGSFTGSFVGDGSGLSGVTADFPTATKNSPLAGTDLFFYNDNNGSNPSKKLSLGTLVTDIAGDGLTVVDSKNLHVDSGSLVAYYSGSIFNTVSGDITISSDGTAAIGSGVIVNADINASANIATSKLAADTISGVALGGDLASLTDGNGIADFSYNGSGAASITVEADGSTLSVGASGVKVADAGITATQLNTSVAGNGLTGGGGSALAVNTGTGLEINADSVRIATSAAGNGLTGGGGSALAVNTGAGLEINSDAVRIATSAAGTGLSGGGGSALSVDYGSSAGTAVEGDTGLTIEGTTSEIEVTGGSITLGSGGTVTIGLPNNVTIENDLTVSNDLSVTNDAVINGDLTVRGTASFEETVNLEVADRFILLASGSGAAGDGGIVIQQTTDKAGAVFAYDGVSTARWGIATNFHASASAYTPEAFMGVIFEGTTAAATSAGYDEKGHIAVDGDDIYIYS